MRRFERARPNELCGWQTDLLTFVLKRQTRQVYLVGFMDDHSRFLVSYGLHATHSAALVIEVLRFAIASYQTPRGILTDHGAQFITWRGKGAFTRECEKSGIRQIVAKPRRPQPLGGGVWVSQEQVAEALRHDEHGREARLSLGKPAGASWRRRFRVEALAARRRSL